MMPRIWKFPLSIIGMQEIEMPEYARILSVQMQNDALCLWAMVDTTRPMEKRTVAIIGTGQPFHSPEKLVYIGTVQQREFVWHVFELDPMRALLKAFQ